MHRVPTFPHSSPLIRSSSVVRIEKSNSRSFSEMAKFAFQAVLSLAVLMLAVAAPQSGPKVTFFNYSGMQATVHCVDNPPKILEAGDTCIVPLTSSDQSCIVALKDGEHASATVDKLFPSSTNSGHSISVDINDTFLFFAVEDAPHHQYVSFLDSQNEQIRAESNSDLLLWSMENASDE